MRGEWLQQPVSAIMVVVVLAVVMGALDDGGNCVGAAFVASGDR